MTDSIDAKIRRYVDTFGQNVPVFCMPQMTDDELADVLDECLRTGKPIELELPDDPTIIY